MLDWVRGSVTCVFLAFPKMETAWLVGHADWLSVADALDRSSHQSPLFLKDILVFQLVSRYKNIQGSLHVVKTPTNQPHQWMQLTFVLLDPFCYCFLWPAEAFWCSALIVCAR